MAAGTFRGCFKMHTRLRKLFSDGENVSQVCRNFFRTAKMFRRSAGTFRGWRKRHACLWKHFSEGEMCSTFPGEQGTGVIDVLFGTGMLKEDVPRRYSRKKRGSVRRSRNSLGRIVGYSEKGGVCF